MKKQSLLKDFYLLLRENKNWWMIPILLSLMLLTVFVLLSGTAAAPFIYALF